MVNPDQDHLRDDPELPVAVNVEHPRPEWRRTPILRPLGMNDDEADDFDLGLE